MLIYRLDAYSIKFNLIFYKVISGRLPDGKNIMARARQESIEFKKAYDVDISGKVIFFY